MSPGCVLCVFVSCFCLDLVEATKSQLSDGTTFRVPGRIGFGVGRMFFGGGSCSGGCFGTLGATVPQNDSLKDAGGLWAPPPCHLPNLDLQSCLADEFC